MFRVNDDEGWMMGRLIVTEFMTPDGVAEVEERHDEVHVIGSLDLVQTL